MKKYGWNLESTYTTLPEHCYVRVAPTRVSSPRIVVFNYPLAQELGLNFTNIPDDELAELFSGNRLPEGAVPFAEAYAGHQFGYFTMLGDGRAHVIGEQVTPDGSRFDIQLKGYGKTPYSRRGDGRAALGPMLREYIVSEAMHALGIPTTRSLAVVTTGEEVLRERVLQGAILTRVAASHIRVGTFEYLAARDDSAGLKQLADYVIGRHYPEIRSSTTNAQEMYRALLRAIIDRQAKLIAAWMQVGFIHGVMNTDNMAISGETIDYGPCAFMDTFSMSTVFSSIDRDGRYAYGNQPTIAHWNLARLAETFIPLLHDDSRHGIAIAESELATFSSTFNASWLSGMSAKLGLTNEEVDDLKLVQELLAWMEASEADFTTTFRDLCHQELPNDPRYKSPPFQSWYSRWLSRLERNNQPLESARALMRKRNPVVIPRNHRVEEALMAAENGIMQQVYSLLTAITAPFEETETNKPYRDAPHERNVGYRTFCGT
jgi:uncharacterized protein YdiU (UPF0061 family)